MRYTAEDLLAALLDAAPRPTSEAPQDARGLYGLIDHTGELRYIGSTSSAVETLFTVASASCCAPTLSPSGAGSAIGKAILCASNKSWAKTM